MTDPIWRTEIIKIIDLNEIHFLQSLMLKLEMKKISQNSWVKFSEWELVPDITDYQLEFITQKIQKTDPHMAD